MLAGFCEAAAFCRQEHYNIPTASCLLFGYNGMVNFVSVWLKNAEERLKTACLQQKVEKPHRLLFNAVSFFAAKEGTYVFFYLFNDAETRLVCTPRHMRCKTGTVTVGKKGIGAIFGEGLF